MSLFDNTEIAEEAKVPVTKIVFVSRHEPSLEQLEILQNNYPGLPIETRAVVFGPEIDSLSKQLKKANMWGEFWVVVAPTHHVIWAYRKKCHFGSFSNKPSSRGAGQFDVENFFEYDGPVVSSLDENKKLQWVMI